MDKTNNLKIGQVVRSKNGRDTGKIFLILEILDNEHVLIADGKRRTLEKPKKKKVKHLYIYNDILDVVTSKKTGKYQFNDSFIRTILEPYNN